jgi:predicted metal-dependent hydrolase
LIDYTIVRKFRLKHTYIHVKSDASVEIKTSLSASKKSIEAFVERKSSWIKKKQAFFQNRKTLEREKFYLFGEVCEKMDYKVASDDKLDALYRQKAIETINPLVQIWSEQMQLFPTAIGYRKNRTRWGSCNSKNRLSFNTNLAKMHPDFIEYVVVHELAHIKHKNHSKAFWKEVEKFLPAYRSRKKLII